MNSTKKHDHGHREAMRSRSRTGLSIALAINAVFLAVEVAGGILSDSLALLADAGHMLSDVSALGLSLFVSVLAARPATEKRTFGLLRAEVLGAFINGGSLFLIVGVIFWEAWRRFGQVQMIDGPLMLVVAVMGLAANLVSAMVLAKSRKENINVRGAFLHMIADALGSVGVIVAGAVILLTGWNPVDLIVSIGIGLLILWSTMFFFKETLDILMEATPRGIDYAEVKRALENVPHVQKVHDLHIWTITSGMPALTAHLVMSPGCCEASHWPVCLAKAKTAVRDRFGIAHSTLEIEMSGAEICEGRCEFLGNEED